MDYSMFGLLDSFALMIIVATFSFLFGLRIWRSTRLNKIDRALFFLHSIVFGLMWLARVASMNVWFVSRESAMVVGAFYAFIFLFGVQLIFAIAFVGYDFWKKIHGWLPIVVGFFISSVAWSFITSFSNPILSGAYDWGLVFRVGDQLPLYGLVFLFCMILAIFIALFLNGAPHEDKFGQYMGYRYLISGILVYEFFSILEFSGFFDGFLSLGLVMIILISMCLSYIGFLKRRIDTFGVLLEYKIKLPVMMKAFFFGLCTIIIPLFLALRMILYSLKDLVSRSNGMDIDVSLLSAQIGVLVLIIALFAFFMGMIMIRGLQNRVLLIVQSMYEVLNHNFKIRIVGHANSDELGSLVQSFNKMASNLDGFSAEIDEYRNLLDQKVATRTRELVEKSRESEELVKKIKEVSSRLQERTGHIVDQIQDGLIFIDEHGVIVRVNKAFIDIFNIPFDIIIGSAFRELDLVKEYPEILVSLEKVLHERLVDMDIRLSLRPPLSGLAECHFSGFDLGNNTWGAIIMVRSRLLPWGVIYESLSGLPIHGVVVRLYNQANNKIIAEESSDDGGRFLFYAIPGLYYVRFFKEGYSFPSTNRLGYKGEVIEVKTKEDCVIHFDVFMELTA